MKVRELFEKKNEFGLSSGAYFKPVYDEKIKQLRGSVIDWMESIGATKQDIAKALAQVKALPLVRNDLPAAGLEYEEKPASEARGTLNFRVRRRAVNKYAKKISVYSTSYQVHANGQIRHTAHPDGEWVAGQTKLVSPKPQLVAGDPVRSIVKTMTAALEELLRKWKVSSGNMDKQIEKFQKEN